MSIDRPGRQSGLTIVELILFIVIVGVAAAAVLATFSVTANASADPVRRKQALLIAEGLLEEVQQAAYTFCDPSDTVVLEPLKPTDCSVREVVGPEAGTPGRPYDNVNDYVSQLNAAQPAFNSNNVLTDAAGTSLGVNGYAATLTLRAEALNGIASADTADGLEVLRATVRVTYGTGVSDFIELDAYRTRYAPQVAQ